MTDWELMYINLLELQAAHYKELEEEFRERRQDLEKELRNLKLARTLPDKTVEAVH